MTWQPYGQKPFGHSALKGKQRREAEREPTNRTGVLHYKGTRIPVVLEDISRTGTRMKLPPTIGDQPLENDMQLEIPGLVKMPVDMRWRDGSAIGAQFGFTGPRLAILGTQIKTMLGRR